MSREPRERFMFGCLLVALMVGIVAVKFWVVSVEERLAVNLAIHQTSVGTDRSQTNVLYNHENRLRRVEYNDIAFQDYQRFCEGWPTQQQIAQGE
jgi:hypothetical protein